MLHIILKIETLKWLALICWYYFRLYLYFENSKNINCRTIEKISE